MYELVIGLIILLSVLLVLVVLAQNSKGGGLSNQFGGSSASNIIGVKKTGDLLEKLTWGFIIGIMALTLSTNFIDKTGANSGGSVLDNIQTNSAPAPLETQPEGDVPATDSAAK
jgi:preprotein translocase subunit SecG